MSCRWHPWNVTVKRSMEALFLRDRPATPRACWLAVQRYSSIYFAWVVLAVATTVLALPHARAPGLFYDEAVHAGAAKD